MAELERISHVNNVGEKNIIYCKKLHALTKVNKLPCLSSEGCDYFESIGQGECVICNWKDEPLKGGKIFKIINGEVGAREELVRVSKLIDEKILKKG